MKIKEVADKLNITPATVRYYERIGVIPKVKKDDKGYRVYSQIYIDYLEYVQLLKKGGMSLENIIKYVDLSLLGDTTIEARKGILFEEKKLIEANILALQKNLKVINQKIDNYYLEVLPKTNALIRKTNEELG